MGTARVVETPSLGGVCSVPGCSGEPVAVACLSANRGAEPCSVQGALDGRHAFQESRTEQSHGAVELLHRASVAGAVSVLRFLVTEGFAPVTGHCLDARGRGRQGKTSVPLSPLHSAAASGSFDSAVALLELRAAITGTEAKGAMALHLAAGRGATDIVSLLLQAKSPLAAKDLNLQTVLHFSARSGNVESLSLLLQHWLADVQLVNQGERVYGGPLDWREPMAQGLPCIGRCSMGMSTPSVRCWKPGRPQCLLA